MGKQMQEVRGWVVHGVILSESKHMQTMTEGWRIMIIMREVVL